tara:strand:+ start:480 stop:1355 length:876 start_codon:yes stop_codon:yes gene_type:complete
MAEYTKEQIQKASYPDLVENNLTTSKIPLKRLDTKHGRVYYQRNVDVADRSYLYSSTTILDNVLAKGIGFNMWLGNSQSFESAMNYARERANIGTCCHALCMYLIWGETVDCTHGYFSEDSMRIEPVPDEVKVRLQAFIDFCHDYSPESIATEISLYTLDRDEDGDMLFPWAGTADNIMRIEGKLYLIDIKTGKEYKHSHELQLTSYKLLWDHLYGDEHGKIDKVACLYLNSRGKYKLVKHNFVPKEWFFIYDVFEYLLKDKRGKMPKISEPDKLPDIYSIKKENEDGVKQ